MVRIQLHLTEDQDLRLRATARRRGTARAAIIRRGIELVLREEGADGDPVLALIGAAGPAERTDVAEHHDEILYGRA